MNAEGVDYEDLTKLFALTAEIVQKSMKAESSKRADPSSQSQDQSDLVSSRRMDKLQDGNSNRESRELGQEENSEQGHDSQSMRVQYQQQELAEFMGAIDSLFTRGDNETRNKLSLSDALGRFETIKLDDDQAPDDEGQEAGGDDNEEKNVAQVNSEVPENSHLDQNQGMLDGNDLNAPSTDKGKNEAEREGLMHESYRNRDRDPDSVSKFSEI